MANPNGSYRRAGRGTALYVTMAGAFTVIILITAMALFFKISDITVEGGGRYSAEEIIAASGLEKDNSIFFTSSGSAEVAIKSELPYVDTVKVERRLPGTIVIKVTESTAMAYVSSGSSLWIIDQNARIVEEVTTAPAGAIEIRGITPESPEVGKSLSLGSDEKVRLRAMTDMLDALREDGKLDKTEWLDLTNLSAITFGYNGYRINFGTTSDLKSKLDCLNSFIADYPDPGHGQEAVYNESDKGLYYNG